MNDYIKHISGYCYYIDNTMTLKEVLDTLYLLPSELVDDLYAYIVREYRSSIVRIMQNKDSLIDNNKLLSLSVKILESYNKSIEFALLAGYICYNIENEKYDIETFIETMKMTQETLVVHKPVSFSKGIKTTLRPHQQNCFNHIKNKPQNIIIAPTGSGKTLMAIYYCEYMYWNNTVDNIVFIAERNEDIIYKEIRKHLKSNNGLKYTVCTYFNMKNTLSPDKDYSKTLVILDEVHSLKNKTSSRGAFIKSLNLKHFLGITATIVDKPQDLVSLFNNLNISQFQYSDIIYSIASQVTESEYNINEVRVPMKLSTKEREAYVNLEDENEVFFTVLNRCLRYTSKLYSRMAQIHDIITTHSEDQIIVFCNYLDSADMIYNHLRYLDVSVDIITGKHNSIVKDKIIQAFLKNKTRVLITTSVLKASYNLQNANVIVFSDYNYGVIQRIQAEGRIKRIGQDKPVYLYDIYYENTWEEEIIDIIDSKKKTLFTIQENPDSIDTIIQESLKSKRRDRR